MPSTRPAREDAYSVAEAAAILGISTRRVRQMIEEGKLEARRTALGAFRLAGEPVREERLRRTRSETPEAGPDANEVSSAPSSPVHGPGLPTRSAWPDAFETQQAHARGHRVRVPEGSWSRWIVAATGTSLLIGGVVVALAHGDADRASSRGAVSTQSRPAPSQRVVLLIDPPPLGGLQNPTGRIVDAYVPSDFSVHEGSTVLLTIFNYDDTPHTFTSTALGVDLLVPPAHSGGPTSVSVRFTPPPAGSYRWRCRVVCDSWSMKTRGYMSGTVRVLGAR